MFKMLMRLNKIKIGKIEITIIPPKIIIKI